MSPETKKLLSNKDTQNHFASLALSKITLYRQHDIIHSEHRFAAHDDLAEFEEIMKLLYNAVVHLSQFELIALNMYFRHWNPELFIAVDMNRIHEAEKALVKVVADYCEQP